MKDDDNEDRYPTDGALIAEMRNGDCISMIPPMFDRYLRDFTDMHGNAARVAESEAGAERMNVEWS
jgi:hypothetical protein